MIVFLDKLKFPRFPQLLETPSLSNFKEPSLYYLNFGGEKFRKLARTVGKVYQKAAAALIPLSANGTAPTATQFAYEIIADQVFISNEHIVDGRSD